MHGIGGGGCLGEVGGTEGVYLTVSQGNGEHI